MLTDYALQTIYGSTLYNNGPFYQNSYLNDNLAIHDDYGYQRGTVDHLGRVIDSMGNPSGFQLNNGKIIDSLGSSYGYVNHCDRINNILGQDSGFTVRNFNTRYEIPKDPILPTYPRHNYKEETCKIRIFGSSSRCESCGQTDGHAIWCRNRWK